jgi:prolyl oligopeptidase
MNASRTLGLVLCAGLLVGACSHEKKASTQAEMKGGDATASAGAVSTTYKAPETRIEAVKDNVHGTEIIDNYRWLEGDNSDAAHMGKMTDEVAAWTDAQNKYTRDVLDNLPGRKELEDRLRPLMEVGSVSAPQMCANRYFYSKREGNQNQPLIYVRDGYRGEPRLLIDPATIDSSGLVTVAGVWPTEDGKWLAYGTYRAGDENSMLHLMNVDTGEVQPLEIPGKVSGCDWLPDDSGFVYRNLADIKNPYSGQVMYHAMGSQVASDKLIFRQYTEDECKKNNLDPKLATTYGPEGGLSKDGRWLELAYATDTRNNDLWVADFNKWLKTGQLEGDAVTEGEKAQTSGTIVGDQMYIQTTLDAPNGRVCLVDLHNPGKANWKVLIPERKDAVIQNVHVCKDVLAVDYLHNACSMVALFDLSGKSKGELKLPGIGSASLATEQDRYEAYLTFTSYNYPSSIFRVDLDKPARQPELWERPDVPVDPSKVDVKQVWYKSKDGTKVSMFIISKKGLKLNGKNPTILYGYGGFTISMTPAFSAPLFSWYEDGGVYAVANLRGGGEYGDSWHKDGMLEHKQNVFDDMIAAAEYLCSSGYTNPDKLACSGGSNGGLLTGAMVTQRPDLFKAAIVAVPLLDMVRFDDFLMAKYWVPEYGTAKKSDQFQYIYQYSPYQHIVYGTKYPAVLLTAGENDSRVHPMHARKMCAALQAATTNDPTTHPVLLWVDREAGHGQGKPLNLRIRDAADQRMFLMWQLGMLGN